MAGNLRADSVVMKETAGKVGNIVGDMKSTITALTNEVEQTASYWKGTAQNKYQAAMAEWNNIADRLKSALDAMSQNLDANSKQYAATEEASANSFKLNN